MTWVAATDALKHPVLWLFAVLLLFASFFHQKASEAVVARGSRSQFASLYITPSIVEGT
jgi:hypothetical protein